MTWVLPICRARLCASSDDELFGVGERYASDIRPNSEPWDEEQRTAVFSRQATAAWLKVFVVIVPISASCGLERPLHWRRFNSSAKLMEYGDQWPDYEPLGKPIRN